MYGSNPKVIGELSRNQHRLWGRKAIHNPRLPEGKTETEQSPEAWDLGMVGMKLSGPSNLANKNLVTLLNFRL